MMANRNRGGTGMESIGTIIEDVLSKGKLGKSTQVAQLWGQWKSIVGEDVAEHSCPEKVSRGKLYVNVDSPVWCQQLDLMKEELKDKIEETLVNVDIKHIVFKTAPHPEQLWAR